MKKISVHSIDFAAATISFCYDTDKIFVLSESVSDLNDLCKFLKFLCPRFQPEDMTF